MKRVLSLVLSVVLLVSVFSIPVQAVESDDWTDEKREAYLLKCQTENLSFDEMIPVMDQDEKLASMIISWLAEVSEPMHIEAGDSEFDGNQPIPLIDYGYEINLRPDLSDKSCDRAVMKLFITTSKGKHYEATGYMLGGNTLVTSAHNIYSLFTKNPSRPDDIRYEEFPYHTFADDVLCVPVAYCEESKYDSDKLTWTFPIGYASADVEHVYIPDVWRNVADLSDEYAGYDYAIMSLYNKSFNFESNFLWNIVPTRLSISIITGLSTIRMLGYPADTSNDLPNESFVERNSMHIGTASSAIYNIGDSGNIYNFGLSGYMGMSGAPLLDLEDNFIGIYHGTRPSGIAEYCGVTEVMINQIYEYTQGSYWDYGKKCWKKNELLN